MGIRARLIFFALLVTVIPGLFFTLLLWKNMERNLIEEERSHLDSLAELTKDRLLGAIELNVDRVSLITSRVQLRTALERYLQDGSEASLRSMKASLVLAKKSVESIQGVFLLDATGRLLISTDTLDSAPDFLQSPIFARGKEKPTVLLLGPNPLGDILLASAPITVDGNLLGVVILQTDARGIKTIAEDYTDLSETGEFLLGTRNEQGDAVFLTRPRFKERSGALEVIPKDRVDVPITQALLGKDSFVFDGVDYKGDRILAATRYIPGVDWGIEVKVDREEVLGPLRRMMLLIGFLSVTILVILIVVALSLAQGIVNPLYRLQRGTQIIAEGNLQHKVGTQAPDEIGDLSRSFDTMTERLAMVMASRSELAAEILKRDEVERRFATVVESSPNALILVDHTRKMTLVNQRAVDLFGYARHEMIGEKIELLVPDRFRAAHPEHVQSFFQAPSVRALGAGRDLFGRRKDGSVVPVEVGLSPLSTAGESLVLASVMDITERIKARDQILAKNRELETLLHVVSHDLKEPLRSAENFSLMVCDEYAEKLGGEGKDFLMRVVRASQRMGRLLEDVLLLSRARRITVPPGEIEMGSVVEEVLKRLEEKIRETGAVVRVEKNLPRLKMDRTWATQALYNLVSNALKFTRDGEVPQVEIAPYRFEESGRHETGVVVRDRGPGVALQHRERIFSLFQRAVGREIEGTGAGLAIVRTVAEQHGGRAWVQPRKGGGSEFILALPIENLLGGIVR
jgi:PAS domain S-box-containing protein